MKTPLSAVKGEKGLVVPPDDPQRLKLAILGAKRVERVEYRTVGSGQCTALLQALGFNIHAGAARNWPTAALATGYTVSKVPKKGAALVTSESSQGTGSGHVAYVDEVDDIFLYVTEQNYVSRRISHGKIPLTSPIILAYIYPKGG